MSQFSKCKRPSSLWTSPQYLRQTGHHLHEPVLSFHIKKATLFTNQSLASKANRPSSSWTSPEPLRQAGHHLRQWVPGLSVQQTIIFMVSKAPGSDLCIPLQSSSWSARCWGQTSVSLYRQSSSWSAKCWGQTSVSLYRQSSSWSARCLGQTSVSLYRQSSSWSAKCRGQTSVSRCMWRASICSRMKAMVFWRMMPMWDLRVMICSLATSRRDLSLLFSSISFSRACNRKEQSVWCVASSLTAVRGLAQRCHARLLCNIVMQCGQVCAYMHTHTCMNACTHAHGCMHTHTYMHTAYMHACMHPRTHIHVHSICYTKCGGEEKTGQFFN